MKKIVALLFLLGAVPAWAQQIAGRVLDDQKQPLPNAAVQVYQNGVLRGGCITDYDGAYTIRPLDPGKYDALTFYMGYDSLKVSSVIVEKEQRTTQNFTFQKRINKEYRIMIIKEYKKPLVDENSSPHILTKDEIKSVHSTVIY